MAKIKALIADDVDNLRELLKTHLRSFDCSVVKEVNDGGKVISAIRESQPDIVFLDINMPNIDGISILKYLSEENIHQNVWIVSGESEENIKYEAVQAGARGFIEKPFNLDSLKEALNDYRKISDLQCNDQVTKTVLIADDEPLMRDLLKSFLSKIECKILYEVDSGKKALDLLKNNTVPDITFLDIEMPELNGMEVLEQIKRGSIKTYPVIVSAHGTFENVQLAMNAGAEGFVVKPYTEKKIQQVLSKYEKSFQKNIK